MPKMTKRARIYWMGRVQQRVLPGNPLDAAAEATTMNCIYCSTTLSAKEAADGGKLCDTCANDNGDHCIEEDQDEMAEAEMNCGMDRNGRCSQAGTEYCDWNCPFSR